MRDIKELNNILDGDDGQERDIPVDSVVDGMDEAQASAYFNAKADRAGISGDDVNRRLRERRLGFAEPSSDWDQAGVVVHCIYPGQIPTKSHASIVLWDLATCGPMGFVAESLEEILNPCDTCPKVSPDGFEDACLNCLHEAEGYGKCKTCLHNDLGGSEEPCATGLDGYALNDSCTGWSPKAPVDRYEEAFSPDDSCACGRDDCYDCNVPYDPCDDCESWEDGHNNGFCDACGMDEKATDDDMPPTIESVVNTASMDMIKTCLADIQRQRHGLKHAWAGCYQDCTYRNGRDMCFLSNSFCDFDGCRRIGN